MDPNCSSDPLDVAVAVAQAMSQPHDAAIKRESKDAWAEFMSSAQDLPADLMHQPLFHLGQTPPPQTDYMDPLDPSSCLSLMADAAIDKHWAYPQQHQQHQHQQQHQQHHPRPQHPLDYTTSASMFLPPTPPVESPAQAMHSAQFPPWFGLQLNGMPNAAAAAAAATTGIPPEPSPPPSSTMDFGMPSMCYLPQQFQPQPQPNAPPPPKSAAGRGRRRSSPSSSRPYRRRNSSHPSVASVVSLSAHEPVAHFIDGVEHITFLYSHDRLVKEYTVRTDVDGCMLDEIPIEFRVLNAIYPRANVDKEDYDGNRWEYETSCNQLGWKLCWLNQDQLCGRRGLIQRAVDSYRNRHVNMRSRRVTRQEKVANGTLRRRRAKRS